MKSERTSSDNPLVRQDQGRQPPQLNPTRRLAHLQNATNQSPGIDLTGLIIGLLLMSPLNAAVAGNTQLEMIGLQNRPAAEIQPLLTPLLEDGEVISGDGFNLIVKASPARLEEIRKLIERLDGRLHNLVISVLQSSQQTAEQLNAEAALALSPDRIQMHGMIGDTRDFDSRRSAQQLRTLEGQAARIEVGRIRPVENVRIYAPGYGYPGVAVDTQMQEASTGFAVVPRLSGNDEVLVDIAPWSDRFLHGGAIATQGMQTTIHARLGEWMEIGGTGDTSQRDNRGFNGLNYTSRDHELRILIKIDLAD